MIIVVCTIIHKPTGKVSQAIGVEGWRERIDILSEAEEMGNIANSDDEANYTVDWQEHEL